MLIDLCCRVKKETSGNYEKVSCLHSSLVVLLMLVQLLVALLNGQRPDWGVVQQTIQSDVEVIFFYFFFF